MSLPRAAATMLLAAAAAALPVLIARPSQGSSEPLDFNRDVRPILAENCFLCHGPDPGSRKAKLRLDTRDGATAPRRAAAAVVPGDRKASELWFRITTGEPDDRMPPPESGKSLNAAQIAVLGRWIDEGADYPPHWSLVPPQRPALPPVADPSWPRNPIDAFVLARLEREGMPPSPAADAATLLRRAALDLTGLPPSPAELDSFLADPRPDAYERAVDRLLASPRYGEHLARSWLDAARYGDTHGLHLDNERTMWPYRDWVVQAFDRNLPFDQFTIEQLAGDLLPEPTREQLVATGFNRCNPTSAEGGMIAEEFLAKYAMDRVDTTATVWLGMTLGCAQCHDHKFDPLTQRDYYRMFAFFNNFDEQASDENILAPPPLLEVPSAAQEARLAELEDRLAACRAALDAPLPAIDAAQAEWELEQRWTLAARWRTLVPDALASLRGAVLHAAPDGTVDVAGANPDTEVYEFRADTSATAIAALRLDALLPDGAIGVGRWEDNGNIVLSGFEVEAAPRGSEDFAPVPLALALADWSQERWPVAAALDGRADTGWALLPRTREDHHAVFAAAAPFGYPGGTTLRVRLRFESVHRQHALRRFRLAVTEDPALTPVRAAGWQLFGPFAAASGTEAHERDFGPEAAQRDGARSDEAPAAALAFPDGELHALADGVGATYLARTIEAPTARQVALFLGSDDSFRLWHDGVLVADRFVARSLAADQDRVELDLHPGPNRLLLKVANHGGAGGFSCRLVEDELGGLSRPLAQALRHGPTARSEAERVALRDHFRRRHSPEWAAALAEIAALEEEQTSLRAAIPRTLVVRERADRRPAHLLRRGQYDAPAEEALEPGIPAVFGELPLAAGASASRLDLARWLVSPSHPLTARVAVNRLWQRFFGVGLVKTAEDFGTQGEWPSHPELLDWLATELVACGWDLRHVQRLIATSATYRQSSRVTAELLERDPHNRLLARGPRHRLDAEQIRDLALAASGLLVERAGGPGVRPYQPPGLWEAVGYTSSNTARFTRDDGDALHRRSLYTFWKRTSPPPVMTLFDAPTRETCTVRRERTNTPLQALALMNDEQFVEAARALAGRALAEAGADDPAAVAECAFRWVTSRRPRADELEVLLRVYREQAAAFAAAPAAARALLAVGASATPPELAEPPERLAAWTAVASLILNLDETITKS